MLVIKEEKDREESRGTEGARRATGVAREAAEFNGVGADPEVADKATRRQLSAKYKRRIVREADRCTKPGGAGGVAAARRVVFVGLEHVAAAARGRGAGGIATGQARPEGEASRRTG